MSDDKVESRRNRIQEGQDQYKKYLEHLDRLYADTEGPQKTEKAAFQADPAKAGVESTQTLTLREQNQLLQTDVITKHNPKVGDQREDGTRFAQQTAGLSAGLGQSQAGVGLRQPRSNPAQSRAQKVDPTAEQLEARYEVAIDDNEEGLERVKNPATSGAVDAMGNPIEVEASESQQQPEVEAAQETTTEVGEEKVETEKTEILDPDRTRVNVTQEELGNPETWYRDQFAAGADVVQGEVEFEDKNKTQAMGDQDKASPTEATVQVRRDDIRKDSE